MAGLPACPGLSRSSAYMCLALCVFSLFQPNSVHGLVPSPQVSRCRSSCAHAWGPLLRLPLCMFTTLSVAWRLPRRRFKSWSLVKAIFLSWLIAFFEYCLQVPANR